MALKKFKLDKKARALQAEFGRMYRLISEAQEKTDIKIKEIVNYCKDNRSRVK